MKSRQFARLLCVAFILWTTPSILAQDAGLVQNAGKLTPIPFGTTTSPYGFYEYLPPNYDGTTKVPLLIALGGVGQKGNGHSQLSKMINITPLRRANLINQNPTNAQGRHYPAIIISPQSTNGWYKPDNLKTLIDLCKQLYAIDETRIYMTGPSAGGKNTIEFMDHYPDELAASIPICNAGYNRFKNKELLADIPSWYFHNHEDPTIAAVKTLSVLNQVTGSYPIRGSQAKSITEDQSYLFDNGTWINRSGTITPTGKIGFTLYYGFSHNAWSKTYNNDEVFNWLFAQSKNRTQQPFPPMANAGSDQIINTSISSTTLDGSMSTGPDNDIVEYQWRNLTNAGPHNRINFNFSQGGQDVTGWNTNTTTKQIYASGTIFNQLIDQTGIPTSVSLEIIDGWNGAAPRGVNTGSNSGDLADAISSTFWWMKAGTEKQMRLAGLIPNTTYEVSFLGSRDGNSASERVTTFTANGTSTSVNVLGNTSLANLSVLSDENGEILITVQAGDQASHAYINALSIVNQTTSNTTITIENPNSVITTVSGLTTTGSYNFELQITDTQGFYDLDTVTIDVIQKKNNAPYANAGDDIFLKNGQNTSALDGSESTDYDGDELHYEWRLVYPTPLAQTGAIQLNFGNSNVSAPDGWNNFANFNQLSTSGTILNNLVDENGNLSDIQVVIDDAWKSSGRNGMVTGNNSGDAPDDVLRTYWWFNTRDPKSLTIRGLIPEQRYNFLVLGSRKGTSGTSRNVSYTINGQEQIDNVINNTTGLTFESIIANAQGEAQLIVDIRNSAGYAYINGIVITPLVSSSIVIHDPIAPATTVEGLGNAPYYDFELLVTDEFGLTDTDTVRIFSETVNARIKRPDEAPTVYPNPATGGTLFTGNLSLQHYRLLDISGNEVAHGRIDSGTIQLNNTLKNGVYIILLWNKDEEMYSKKIILNR